MKPITSAVSVTSLLLATPALAADLEGPARFCGYAPIVDLLPGEKITTLEGGIHGGSFRWEGPFGSLEVQGIGWASCPKRRMLNKPTADQPAVFAQRRVKEGYQVPTWNGSHAAAYFASASRMREPT